MLTFTQFVTEAYGGLEDAKTVIKTLNAAGYKGYLVGGCVRDTLLGHKPKDFDVATDATPDQVIGLFPDAQLVGKQFGVVIAHGIDIATFRKDGVYTDGRRPDSVEFTTDPKDDADRRDFTVNALFMNPFTGEILDFHNGRVDAKNKLIRAVGRADDRFTQDHLRMLRADRFAAKLGFEIHPDTENSMTRNSHHIANIDVERITLELTKALAHDANRTLLSMKKTGMLQHVLPEVSIQNPTDSAVTFSTLSHLGTNVSPELGFAAALVRVPVPTVLKMGKRLKLSNDELGRIVNILNLQGRISAVTKGTTLDVVKRLMRSHDFREALTLYGVRVAARDPHAHADAQHHLETMFSNLTHEDLNPERFVTGDDLIALGYRPGKAFKDILDKVENAQLSGEVKSKQQALAFVRSLQ